MSKRTTKKEGERRRMKRMLWWFVRMGTANLASLFCLNIIHIIIVKIGNGKNLGHHIMLEECIRRKWFCCEGLLFRVG